MRLQDNIQHKKRFGQFFSGKVVADMLFSLLPQAHLWSNVVDPMAGTGDMLIAVKEHASGKINSLLGVEIDKSIADICSARLPEANIYNEDAFTSAKLITSTGFDLVITNPPYVRYQLQSTDNDIMPTAQEIRNNLIKQIESLSYISEREKTLLLNLAKNYSGLADMAVPAWILCAALIRKGGYLAIVVPETWLTRNYANPIQYLLLKLFHVETIAKDTNAKWFPEATVKTCLVVARREELQDLSIAAKNQTRIIDVNNDCTQCTAMLFSHLKGVKEFKKWALAEDLSFFTGQTKNLPYELQKIIKTKHTVEYIALSDFDIECGQGLRTGANAFFYVGIKEVVGTSIRIQSKTWDHGGKVYCVKKDDIILSLQNRGEIEGLIIRSEKITTGVVYPQGKLRGNIRKYIASAEEYRDSTGRRFKDYSAVKPNEKRHGAKIVREWYRLPGMTPRHLPDLCLTRVSAQIPECLFVAQCENEPIAIDANMVTLWCKDRGMVQIALALLNSTWSKLSLELICTVMGGGALKIEASHLRKVVFPKLNKSAQEGLRITGEKLIQKGFMTEEIQDEIDRIIAIAIKDDLITEKMRVLLAQKYKERSTR